MLGLTAKVFRTYNASITLQQQLKELTNSKMTHSFCHEAVCHLYLNNDGLNGLYIPTGSSSFRRVTIISLPLFIT